MGWLIGLGAVLLAGLIPIGLHGIYDANGGRVWLKICFLSLQMYPKQRKATKKNKSSKPRSGKAKSAQTSHKKTGGSSADFAPIVKIFLEFIKNFRRKLRVNNLELKVILTDEDPGDLAIHYGQAWAALGNLMPILESSCVIDKRNLEVECDFAGTKTKVFADVYISITLGRALALLVCHGPRIIKYYYQIINKRKGGAEA